MSICVAHLGTNSMAFARAEHQALLVTLPSRANCITIDGANKRADEYSDHESFEPLPTAAPSLGPPSTAPTATCPDNYTASPVSQRCYIEAGSSLSWTACETECESRGDIMFCPRSSEDNDFAFEEFTTLSGYNEDDVDPRNFKVWDYGAFWIGYSGASGTFEWVQGCDSNYTNWDTSYPNGFAGYYYTHVSFDGTWADYLDYSYFKCICETAAVVPSSMPTELPSSCVSVCFSHSGTDVVAFVRADRRAILFAIIHANRGALGCANERAYLFSDGYPDLYSFELTG
ncbi:hypothetical protein CTAYLR_004334 [Chrysophaeum taylorii]|uniref:C-type lectin domain-containing protein n=1 Tax=Chrysophaeum taylorii TaxID=2483200 RepID=A0AAD7UGH7_9STRA|nr:hypothetical protein CTAYLR_004334 [Chrysophaeum taylorii]